MLEVTVGVSSYQAACLLKIRFNTYINLVFHTDTDT